MDCKKSVDLKIEALIFKQLEATLSTSEQLGYIGKSLGAENGGEMAQDCRDGSEMGKRISMNLKATQIVVWNISPGSFRIFPDLSGSFPHPETIFAYLSYLAAFGVVQDKQDCQDEHEFHKLFFKRCFYAKVRNPNFCNTT